MSTGKTMRETARYIERKTGRRVHATYTGGTHVRYFVEGLSDIFVDGSTNSDHRAQRNLLARVRRAIKESEEQDAA